MNTINDEVCYFVNERFVHHTCVAIIVGRQSISNLIVVMVNNLKNIIWQDVVTNTETENSTEGGAIKMLRMNIPGKNNWELRDPKIYTKC